MIRFFVFRAFSEVLAVGVSLLPRKAATRPSDTKPLTKIAAMGRKKIQISRITDERNRQVFIYKK